MGNLQVKSGDCAWLSVSRSDVFSRKVPEYINKERKHGPMHQETWLLDLALPLAVAIVR